MTFANISNHPSTHWDETQRAAALRHGRRIIDIPFPVVPPEASPGEVSAMAAEIVLGLPLDTREAMVQGEFTLAFTLVRRLQRRGIICLAATTKRVVEMLDDGSTLRKFVFVRFRPYEAPSD